MQDVKGGRRLLLHCACGDGAEAIKDVAPRLNRVHEGAKLRAEPVKVERIEELDTLTSFAIWRTLGRGE